MSYSEPHDDPPLATVLDEAALREQFSRLTDRFALPLASPDRAGQSLSDTGSSSARGGLSTSNSASTGEALEPPRALPKGTTAGEGRRLSAPPSQPSPSSLFKAQRRPYDPAPAHTPAAASVPSHAASVPAIGGAKAVLLFSHLAGPSRGRHARPASATAAATKRTAPTTPHAHEPQSRPSRPMRPSSAQPVVRRSSTLQAPRPASNGPSPATTPRATGASGGRTTRSRPASAQPPSGRALGGAGPPSAPPSGGGSGGLGPREAPAAGRVYVRRLIRPKLARAGVPESPYYHAAAAATSATPAFPTTAHAHRASTEAGGSTASSTSALPMRAHLTRPALIARPGHRASHATPSTASRSGWAEDGRVASAAATPELTESLSRTSGGASSPDASTASSCLTPPPPLSELRGKASTYARHHAPVTALNAADVATTADVGSQPRPRPGPSLSSPSGGLAFARLGDFTPHAPPTESVGSRRSSMRRISRSGSSCRAGPPRPVLSGARASHGTGPDLAAGASTSDPFVAASAASPRSDTSGSPDAISSPTALAQRLREHGNDCFRRAQYAEAIRYYSEGLQLQPSSEVVACNRAAAYLMSFRYAAALVDCKWVLLHAPKNLSAHWRAAKSFLYTNRLAEARRFYRTARQLSEEDYATACGGTRLDAMGSRAGSLGSTAHTHGSGSGSGHSGQVKWLKDRRSICAEEAALPDVELFWQQMREDDWPAAINTTSRLMDVFGSDGPAAAVWQARQLEAMLHVDARQSMDKVRALRALYPECLDLIFVEAKALFYCAHDDHSTRQSLALLDELRACAAGMNEQLVHTVQQLAGHVYRSRSPHSSGAAVAPENDVESWAQLYQWKPDSRLVQLQRAIELFAKYRDDGNGAYVKSDWAAAHIAYTRCLQVDPANRSLMSTTYCNRSAVAMQSSRWKDALADAHAAIELNPLHTKAVSRRARIYLHLFQQQEERLLHTASPHGGSREWVRTTREAMLRYLDAAVEDFKAAAHLAPQDVKLQQDLQEAMQCRHGFLQQQQQQDAAASPFSSHARPPSASFKSRPASTGRSYARQRRGPQFFTADDYDQGDRKPHAQHQQQSGNAQHRARSSPAAPDGRAVLLRYIEVLELPTTAYASGKVEPRALTKAYRDAALRWHPDKWVSGTTQEKATAEVRFKEVTVAYTALKECAA